MDNVRYVGLPDKLFLVRVPIVCTYSQEEIDILGLPVTYNVDSGAYVADAYKNLTTCMLPLTKIIDIYTSNYPIYVVNEEDVKTIYDILNRYFHGLDEQGNFDYNVQGQVEDRLADIKKFATEMFGLNTEQLKPKRERTFVTHFDDVPVINTSTVEKDTEFLELANKVNMYKPTYTVEHNRHLNNNQIDVSSAYDNLPNFGRRS